MCEFGLFFLIPLAQIYDMEMPVMTEPVIALNDERDAFLSLALNPDKIDNAVLKRLVSEVQFDAHNQVNAYNRTHNRHNRGR